MSNTRNEEIHDALCELITKITHFKAGSDQFVKLETKIVDKVKRSDTMYFLSPKDILEEIRGVSHKFVLNGFRKHAERLNDLAARLINENVPKSELNTRMNAVKMLLLLSNRPTEAFWKHPERFEELVVDTPDNEDIDGWIAYLKEDIELQPIIHDEADSNSDEDVNEPESPLQLTSHQPQLIIRENPQVQGPTCEELQEKLLNTIQCGWYTDQVIQMVPPSDLYEANVGILWEDHLRQQTFGLIDLDPINVISEYKIMREIIWQMFGMHNSVTFQLCDGKLRPKSNVTIASLRSICFENVMDKFMKDIKLVNDFRKFTHATMLDVNAPNTYKSYAQSVYKLTQSVTMQLCDVENEVKAEETSMTLIKLSLKFDEILKPLYKLQPIQNEMLLNVNEATPAVRAVHLLTQLRKRFDYSLDQLEQNLILSLYLDTIYHYFTTIEGWLVNGYLYDDSGDFPIENKNTCGGIEIDLHTDKPLIDWTMNYEIREELKDLAGSDDLIGIICDRVLEIGRNLHFLHWVVKYDPISCTEGTIHDEFVRKMCQGVDLNREVVDSIDGDEETFEGFEDDGFLTLAFRNVTSLNESRPNPVTYDCIRDLKSHLRSWRQVPESIFNSILDERFSISGLIAKTVLIERYKLDKTLEFLRHIFLFENDMISPFYRKFFNKLNANKYSISSVHLTFSFHDNLIDFYPNFYKSCRILVKSDFNECQNSLEACDKIDLTYEIPWPLDIVITQPQIRHYQSLFKFVIKIKWALYTMSLTSMPVIRTNRSLVGLRFKILHLLTDLHHFIFRCIITVFEVKFALDLEKANSLKSTVRAHHDFITNVYTQMRKINENDGCHMILKCVLLLKMIWKDAVEPNNRLIKKCDDLYLKTYKILNPIIHPTFIYDY